MDWKVFNNMLGRVDAISLACASVGATARSSAPLSDCDIEAARAAQSTMDRIVKNEFYHVLFMGGLDDVQTSLLIDHMRPMMSFRGAVKSVAAASVGDIPQIPEERDYNADVLGVVIRTEKGE